MKINPSHLVRIIRFGVKNIWLHRLRSALTILGIVFGVASVIAMLAIGEGASYEAREKIKELGSTNIILRSIKPPDEAASHQTTRLGVFGLTPDDLWRISTIPSVEKVVPTWEMREDAWYFDGHFSVRLVGTRPEYFSATNLRLAQGRLFNEIDTKENKNVAVIGATVAKTLFPAELAVGKQIRIKGCYFTVVGVAAEKSLTGRSEGSGFEDTGADVYIPFSTRRLFFGEYEARWVSGMAIERNWIRYHRFVVRVKSMEQVPTTAYLIQQLLTATHKRQDYDMMVPLELLRQAEHTKRIFNIVLGSIAAISLLVGGIGIMNIMLATVTERTREIGIRRALGARRRDIMEQFVTEAVILSSSGGLIGVFLGVIIPKVVTRLAGMTTLVTFWSVLISFSISVGVGMIFGIYPARQAASLDPIQALRYE